MAFTVGTFFGGLVRSFSCGMSWGVGGPSQLTVQLVDDPAQGAFFSPPDLGSPAYFQFYGFNFSGLLQKWEKRRGLDGNPVYEVVLTDPREILDGAQVILDAYMGAVGGVRNLFNVYGYWENQAFGGSQANESGMPWPKLRDGLLAICNRPSYGAYGGPLTFRGQAYSLDLSQLPTTPPYYRVGGGAAVGLLEIVAQVCEDFGCDFFVDLVGYTIVVRTASRAAQPGLGTITAVADANHGGTLVRAASGLELRNELTSAFLVGGSQCDLWRTTAVAQFWGYDVDGNPITSSDVDLTFNVGQTGPGEYQTAAVAAQAMTLNSSPVADVLGSVRYNCTTLEMRLAQVNYDSWAFYLETHRRDVANLVGVLSPFAHENAAGAAAIRTDFVNDAARVAEAVTEAAVAGDAHARSVRVYEFVRGMADEYMGKKYLASLPFVLTKTDNETAVTTTSLEVTDGGYLADGAAALGLSPLNEDAFKTADERIVPLAVFDDLAGADLSRVAPGGTAIEGGALYQQVQVDPRIIVAGGVPAVVVTLNGPLTEEARDNVGDVGVMAAVLQMSEGECQEKLKQAALPLKVAPAVRHPAVVCVPLKSNVYTYGPWYAAGAAGKVRVEHDPSLTPWTYGGHGPMTLAANARVLSAVTTMQVSEAGAVELAGAPTTGLGDVLQAGGPTITGVDVQCGPEGVTTSYRFQTFTPRFGVLGKAAAERARKVALAGGQIRRALRAALNSRVSRAEALGNAARTARAWHERQAKAHKRETPHDCLVAFSALDTAGSGLPVVRQQVQSATMEEAVTLSNAHDPLLHRNTAVVSMNGLFRPFSTKVASVDGSLLPRYGDPTVLGAVPNKVNLDPWKARNDVNVYTWGGEYQGLNAFKRGADTADARAVGLRAPLVLVGWGYDTDGNAVPGSGTSQTFAEDHLLRQDTWKAGPLDCLWDDRRKVWTVHDAIKGTTTTDLPPSGLTEGYVSVTPLSGLPYVRKVYNWFSTKVPAGRKVICNYVADDNRWYVVAADCA